MLKITARSDNDDNKLVKSDTVNEIIEREWYGTKRKRPWTWKPELTEQQNSIQQTAEQTLAKQEKEFCDQITLNT